MSETRPTAGRSWSPTSGHIAWLWLALGIVVLTTAAHYFTDTNAIAFHNVYRRVPYIAIVLAAFSHGIRGGLATAIVAAATYAPHAFLHAHMDPSPTVDKAFEMALYLCIGLLTGWLVERQQRAVHALEQSLGERAVLEQELVRAGRMSALGEMAAGLAHEVRNPLASILGSAEALAAEFGEGHRKHRMAALLLSEIHRLEGVVGDFVRFARPTPPEHQPTDIIEIVSAVRDLTQAEAAKRSVEVVLPAVEPSPISADRGQLEQVFLNLFLNAFQALEQASIDGRRVEVRLRNREVAGRTYCCIGVADNGPGVEESLRESVFDPFVTTRADGVGLGLSVSNRIVEGHGGFMELECSGQGAVFWVCLPT